MYYHVWLRMCLCVVTWFDDDDFHPNLSRIEGSQTPALFEIPGTLPSTRAESATLCGTHLVSKGVKFSGSFKCLRCQHGQWMPMACQLGNAKGPNKKFNYRCKVYMASSCCVAKLQDPKVSKVSKVSKVTESRQNLGRLMSCLTITFLSSGSMTCGAAVQSMASQWIAASEIARLVKCSSHKDLKRQRHISSRRLCSRHYELYDLIILISRDVRSFAKCAWIGLDWFLLCAWLWKAGLVWYTVTRIAWQNTCGWFWAVSCSNKPSWISHRKHSCRAHIAVIIGVHWSKTSHFTASTSATVPGSDGPLFFDSRLIHVGVELLQGFQLLDQVLQMSVALQRWDQRPGLLGCPLANQPLGCVWKWGKQKHGKTMINWSTSNFGVPYFQSNLVQRSLWKHQ